MEDHEQFILIAAAAASTIIFAPQSQKTKRKRRVWVRQWIARRNQLGAYACLLQELSAHDSTECRRFLRMSHDSFVELLGLIDQIIRRKDTAMRKSIKPEERLRYLGSGNSFTDLAFLFRIPDCTIHTIVMGTCEAIYRVLKDEHLKVPNTEQDWKQVAYNFAVRWNLPNCIGAMDGKHVRIRSPGGSTHYNYLKYHSIVLLAVVDAKYRFLYFDVGTNGRAGDAAVFRDSSLATALENNSLKIPPPTPLPGRQTPVPYFIVGDDAFPLKPYLLKPFPFRTVMANLNDEAAEAERKKTTDI